MVKNSSEIFKEEWHEIRSPMPAVFFEKTAVKIFRKYPENYPWESTYWKFKTMLNISSIADAFLGILQQHWEALF